MNTIYDLCNLLAAIRYQGFRNMVVTRNGWGIFSRNSHQRGADLKQYYGNAQSAERAAQRMTERYGRAFEGYRCAFCEGFHVGKNQ